MAAAHVQLLAPQHLPTPTAPATPPVVPLAAGSSLPGAAMSKVFAGCRRLKTVEPCPETSSTVLDSAEDADTYKSNVGTHAPVRKAVL